MPVEVRSGNSEMKDVSCFSGSLRTEQPPGRARHVSRPYRDAHIGRSVVSICHHCGIVAVLRYCAAQKREDSSLEVRPSQRYPCRVLPSSLLLFTNRDQSASHNHSVPARAKFGSRFRCRHSEKKVLADLSCDRCLMQLARVASHQTPGAVDEPIGDGVEVTGLLLQVPHPLPCHE